MDQRMFHAAFTGDVNTLHKLLEENPFILSDYALLNTHENPLTIATKSNQLLFVREVLRLKPQLAAEHDQHGFSPLDVASAYGHMEIVQEILATTGPETCRVAGKDGRTAIHYAAVNGRVEIFDVLISACSDCVKDVTSFGQTALHLAVNYFKFEVVRCMLEKDCVVEMVNLGDYEGNTALHYAVLRKQLVSVELLLDLNKRTENRVLEVNAVNKKGLTPMDISDILLIESSNDIKIREILRRAGGYASSEFHVVASNERPKPESNHQPTDDDSLPAGEKPKNWPDLLKYFQFEFKRDSPGEARQTLLVVVALIATVTFEAGINPPSYLFEFEPSNVNMTSNGLSNSTQLSSEIQRRATLVSITVFLVANSVALSTALSIIDYLTVGLPFQRELRVSIFAMVFAYSWSLGSTRPTGTVKTILLTVATLMPLFLRWLPNMITKCRRKPNTSTAA